MNLRVIERVVLNNIGMRYDELSISTDAKEILDFAMLHTCIYLAREEIKLNTRLPCLTMIGTGIVTAAGTSSYSLPADFDIPIAMYYWSIGNSSAILLNQIYMESLPINVPVSVPVAFGAAIFATGTPYGYIIAGTSADLIQMHIVDEPTVAGLILPIYKPVLTELTTFTDEDVLMRKYPKLVIDFATAFAWQILKKDPAQHDKFYALALGKCREIELREKMADANFKEKPPLSIINARIKRLSR